MNETELVKNGWHELETDNLSSLNKELVEIARKLGNPVVNRRHVGLVQELTPKHAIKGFPNSLTAKYSLSNFPLHVDTAHWLTPCRYVILGCLVDGESNRETVLMDFSELSISKAERNVLFNAPFKISNGRNSFYSTVLAKAREFVRYDPGCMTPATKYGLEVTKIFSEERTNRLQKCISWTPGKIVIIDNWRMLHGRGKSIAEGADRVLHRVLVA